MKKILLILLISFVLITTGLNVFADGYNDSSNCLGDEINEVNYDGKDYINYRYGYAIKNNSFAKAGKRITTEGEVNIDVNIMLERVATSFSEEFSLTDKTKYQGLFQNKYQELFAAGFVVGINSNDLGHNWDSFLNQQFMYGSSTADMWGRVYEMSALVYSEVEDKVSLIKDEFLLTWDENKLDLGAPINDASNYTVSLFRYREESTNYMQFFENGYIISKSGVATATTGCVYDEETNSFVKSSIPTGYQEALPSEWGGRVGLGFYIDDTYYQNYNLGYLKAISEGYLSYSFEYISCKNIDAEGNETYVDIDKVLEYVGHNFAGADSGNDSVRKVLPRNYDQAGISAKLKAKYQEYYEKGFVIGTCVSAVKQWEGYIVQDFRFGDGTFAFDEGRREMSFLMYNHRNDTVYLLTDEYANIWNSDKSLGYPVTDSGEFNMILPGETAAESIEMQMFENGFIYFNGTSYVKKIGYKYTPNSNVFQPTPAPNLNANYGALVETIEVDDKTIILAYTNGTIRATNVNGEYEYTYYHGRVYNNGSFEMVPLEDLIGSVGDEFGSTYANEDHISELLKEKYTELYNSGFFPGFKESPFSFFWNEVHAQQFIISDSTASPWEGTRTNVLALVYNSATDKIVVIKDLPLVLWNRGGNYSTENYGPPTNDAFFDEDGNQFQMFQNGLLVIIKNQEDLAYFYHGTYEDYLAGKAEYNKPIPGSVIEQNTNIFNPLLVVIPTAIVILSGLIVTIFVIIKRKRIVG